MQLQDNLGSIMYHESIQPTFSKFNTKKVTFSYLSLRMALVSLVFQFSWLNLWRGEWKQIQTLLIAGQHAKIYSGRPSACLLSYLAGRTIISKDGHRHDEKSQFSRRQTAH